MPPIYSYKKSDVDRAILEEILGWRDVRWSAIILNRKRYGHWVGVRDGDFGPEDKYLTDSYLETIVKAWELVEGYLAANKVDFSLVTESKRRKRGWKVSFSHGKNKVEYWSVNLCEAIANGLLRWHRKS